MMSGFPPRNGLYDPSNERDACGVALIANLNCKQEHEILKQAQQILIRMDHRGACGSEENTGDGVGILTALSYKFFSKLALQLFNQEIFPGKFAVANIFLPQDHKVQNRIKEVAIEIALKYNAQVLGWRKVPIGSVSLGESSRKGEPHIEQIFITCNSVSDPDEFDRKLYFIRKQILNKAKVAELHFCSLSSKTIGILSFNLMNSFFQFIKGN